MNHNILALAPVATPDDWARRVMASYPAANAVSICEPFTGPVTVAAGTCKAWRRISRTVRKLDSL